MHRDERRVVTSLAVVWVAVPVLLAVLQWPHWWLWLAPAQAPITWVQSGVLAAAAVGSIAVAQLKRSMAGGRGGAWWLVAVVFAVLALDERLALHHLLEIRLPRPRELGLRVPPWLVRGDFLLVAMAITGLLVLPLAWTGLRRHRTARRALLLGVGLAGLAVVLDEVKLRSWPWLHANPGRAVEEVVELGSDLALLGAVLLMVVAVRVDASDARLGRPAPDGPSGTST